MKILMLADPASTHTMKWVTSLSNRGIEIALFGMSSCDADLYKQFDVKVYSLNLNNRIKFESETSLSKLSYLKALKKIKCLINEFKPDILHSHYASSYGFLAALSKFKPSIVSVWGSDVLSFPYNSFIHRKILNYSLNRSSLVLATSEFLADQTRNFSQSNIQVTPFGVDIVKFDSIQIKKPFNDNDIVIGTIKSLEKTYGIDKLIEAFRIVKSRQKELPLKLFIVGNGSEENNLKKIANEKIGQNDYIFTGYINHDKIQDYHNMIDISVFLSNQESFGVSILEAMACCRPVVVSNTGGLREIVDEGRNGYFVTPNDPEDAANAIEKLILSPELRIKFGQNGREKVKAFYSWNNSVDLMLSIYKKTLKAN